MSYLDENIEVDVIFLAVRIKMNEFSTYNSNLTK